MFSISCDGKNYTTDLIYKAGSRSKSRQVPKPMSIVDFIAVVSFGLTCFSIGYTFGKDNDKPQK